MGNWTKSHVWLLLLLIFMCIVRCFCKICGSSFDDVQSRAILADIVAEGKIDITYGGDPNLGVLGRYNASVTIFKTFKGELTPPPTRSGRKHRKKVLATVKIGEFAPKTDAEQCVMDVSAEKKYIFFLRKTQQENYYKNAILPVESGKTTLRQIRAILQPDSAAAPQVRPMDDIIAVEGDTVKIQCRVKGNPKPVVRWSKDGRRYKKRRGVRIRRNRRGSTIRIRRVRIQDAGAYTCTATNIMGDVRQNLYLAVNRRSFDFQITALSTTVPVITARVETKFNGASNPTTPSQSVVTTVPRTTPKPTKSAVQNSTVKPTGHYYPCEKQTYCLNGGTCIYIPAIKASFCKCPKEFTGNRCQTKDIFTLLRKMKRAERRHQDRVITVLGIVIGVLVLLGMCLVAYCLAKKRREDFHRRRQWRQKVKADIRNEMATDQPSGPEKVVPVKPKVTRLSSQTQTEPVRVEPINPIDCDFEALFPRMKVGMTTLPTDEAKPSSDSRPRLSGISTMPKPEQCLQNTPAIGESDQGSKDSTPSQSSKTESALRWRYSSEDANSRPGSCIEQEPTSDYDNADSDIETKLSCVPAYVSIDSDPGSLQQLPDANAHQIAAQVIRNFGSGDASSSSDSDSDASSERDILLHRRVAALVGSKGSSDQSSAGGSLTWDEYGNTYSPYAIDDDLDTNNKYLRAAYNDRNIDQHQHLLNVRENQEAVPL
ncbi:uncharacterized protein LOC141903692 isoform X2 [Tubulanus polymorphus]|uniref:uncharacterized protein LOC141903692 isoform X2 n=1 Tax=Tubulanus polymorphus TaxID=672921 RepID=UPI003DA6BC6A